MRHGLPVALALVDEFVDAVQLQPLGLGANRVGLGSWSIATSAVMSWRRGGQIVAAPIVAAVGSQPLAPRTQRQPSVVAEA